MYSVLAFVSLAPAATSAHAQGFLQSLFGGGQPSRQRMMPPRRSYYGSRYTPQNQSVPWWQQGENYQRPRYRHYTAMCVRMCDGYYWPISNRATRSKFYDLARRCEDSCNGDAKMFYMPSTGSDVKRMTDLSGRAYEHINNAFLYRKKLVKSCTCKPMPWSYSAKAKHMKYAAVEAEKRMRVEQLQRRRQAAPKRQQDFVNTPHQRNASTSGRTIVESLDEDAQSETPEHDENLLQPDDDTPVAAGQTAHDATEPQARRVRRRKRPVIRKRRVSRLSAVRQRRRKPKTSWNSGFGGGTSGKVWPGDRPRRR